MLIGDDMGWGKTLSSLAAVAADGAYPAVVVCRPSLTLNWAAEIARFFPSLTVAEAAGTRPQPVPAGTDVIIIGVGRAGRQAPHDLRRRQGVRLGRRTEEDRAEGADHR